MLNDPNYIRTVRRWVKKEGRLTLVDKQQRVLPWWRVDANGSYVFFVRLGSKTIEFEKGKNAIAVRSIDKIPFIINILITAVRNGELDDQLAPAKKPVTAVTTRKAHVFRHRHRRPIDHRLIGRDTRVDGGGHGHDWPCNRAKNKPDDCRDGQQTAYGGQGLHSSNVAQ